MARNRRQKPAATGPLSASRTDHGPSAKATLPASKASRSSQRGPVLTGAVSASASGGGAIVSLLSEEMLSGREMLSWLRTGAADPSSFIEAP